MLSIEVASSDVKYPLFKRLDIPVRPEISQQYANCTLSGTYL